MNKVEAAIAWVKLPNYLENDEQRAICGKAEDLLNPSFHGNTGTNAAGILAEEVEKLRSREKFLAETLCKIAGMGRYAPAGAEGPPNLPTCFEFWNIAESSLWDWRKMVREDNK